MVSYFLLSSLFFILLPCFFCLQIIPFNDDQFIQPIVLDTEDSILFVPQFKLLNQKAYTLYIEPCSGRLNTYLNQSDTIQLLDPLIPNGKIMVHHNNFTSLHSILVYATHASTFTFLFSSKPQPTFEIETNTNLLQVIYTSHLKNGEIRYKSGNYIHMTFYPPKIHPPINFTNDYDTYEYAVYALPITTWTDQSIIAKDNNLCNLATVCGIDYCSNKLLINQQFQSYSTDKNDQIQIYLELEANMNANNMQYTVLVKNMNKNMFTNYAPYYWTQQESTLVVVIVLVTLPILIFVSVVMSIVIMIFILLNRSFTNRNKLSNKIYQVIY